VCATTHTGKLAEQRRKLARTFGTHDCCARLCLGIRAAQHVIGDIVAENDAIASSDVAAIGGNGRPLWPCSDNLRLWQWVEVGQELDQSTRARGLRPRRVRLSFGAVLRVALGAETLLELGGQWLELCPRVERIILRPPESRE